MMEPIRHLTILPQLRKVATLFKSDSSSVTRIGLITIHTRLIWIGVHKESMWVRTIVPHVDLVDQLDRGI